jgi:hypothetical protein
MVVGRLWRPRRWTLRRAALLPAAPAAYPPRTLSSILAARLAALTTPQLCALWRKSRSALTAAATPDLRAEVAGARGALLDELVRREPEVMADWLESGALEPDGPSAYLVR